MVACAVHWCSHTVPILSHGSRMACRSLRPGQSLVPRSSSTWRTLLPPPSLACSLQATWSKNREQNNIISTNSSKISAAIIYPPNTTAPPRLTRPCDFRGQEQRARARDRARVSFKFSRCRISHLIHHQFHTLRPHEV